MCETLQQPDNTLRWAASVFLAFLIGQLRDILQPRILPFRLDTAQPF